MDILINVLAFLVALGVLIAFHEFGHFWVARRAGVAVLRFSVGFGKPLWRLRRGVTEYVVALIPLGGYVRMLDERDTGPASPAWRDQAFNRKPLSARAAIIAAGPVFNFILAFLLYFVVFMIGTTSLRPVLGSVAPGSPAALAGMAAGDEFVAVDGRRVADWEEALLALLDAAAPPREILIDMRDAGGEAYEARIDMRQVNLLDGGTEPIERFGARPWSPPPVFGELPSDGAAARGGLLVGDRVVSFNGRAVATWDEFVVIVRARPDMPTPIVVERDGRRIEAVLQLGRVERNGQVEGLVGARPHYDRQMAANLRELHRYGPLEAAQRALDKTWRVITLTVRILWSMATGRASLDNISGPFTIAEVAGTSAALGLAAFLGIMALLSVSIGIINLLPVPMLDGGQLLYCLIEAVKGSPPSEKMQAAGNRVGVVLLAGLILLALYNDYVRILG